MRLRTANIRSKRRRDKWPTERFVVRKIIQHYLAGQNIEHSGYHMQINLPPYSRANLFARRFIFQLKSQ